jgi:hypothetical protein
MLRVTLAQKITLPLAATVLLLQLGLGAYALHHERQTLLRQLDVRAARLAHAREAFDLHDDQLDTRQIARWLGTTLLEQKDVLFCEVTVGQDQTLFRGGALDKRPSRRYTFPLAAQNPSPTNIKATSADNPSVTGVSAGTLSLALSTADIESALAEARGTLAVGILAGTAFALLLTILIVRYTIGNAVTRLLRNAKIASIHHRGHSTSSPNGDALEQLGEMLNTLTTELHDVVEKEKRLTAQTLAEQVQSGRTVR